LRTIQSKIFTAFGLVALAVILAVTMSAYYHSANTIRKNAIEYISASFRHADDNLQIMLRDIEQITNVVAINHHKVTDVILNPHYAPSYEWFEEKKEVEEFLASLIAYKSYISRIAVVGLNGKTYQSGYPLISNAILREPWVQDVMSENKVHFLFQATSNDSLSVARPLLMKGQTACLVLIDFNREIIPIIYDIQPLEKSLIVLMDNNGNVIFRSDSQLAPEQILAVGEKNPIIDINGDSYLTVRFQSDYSGWVTIGMIPERELLSEVHIIRQQMIIMAAVVLLVVLFLSVLLSNQITKNLKRLRNAMKLVSAGHLSAKPNIRTKDEVGQLSQMFTSMMTNLQQLMEGIRTSERQKREAEYKALQSQINPHFLYNTLNTIKYLAHLQQAPNIEEVSSALVELLRNTADHNQEMITIRKELEIVRQYMTIQKYRSMETITLVFEVEDDQLLDCVTPKLVLQPIVENAIIHGLMRTNKPGLISIRVFRQNDLLKMQVKDNGIGMNAAHIESAIFDTKSDHSRDHPGGIGLMNVNKRIKLAFGEMYGLSIQAEPGLYTMVEMTIPMVKEGLRSDAI
jgi:two-component system sensor histidine kinase YesM